MPKFSVGDTAIITRRNTKLTLVKVIGWRGGGVAPYICSVIKSDDNFYKLGDKVYMPGRNMELAEMQGKKKIYCCVPKCTIYSFESSGTIQWQCSKHDQQPCLVQESPSLAEKVDLILGHLGLEIVIKPSEVILQKATKE